MTRSVLSLSSLLASPDFFEDRFLGLSKRLADARDDRSFRSPYHFLSFLDDEGLEKELQALKTKKETPFLKTIFVVGIGGANLGSKAILDSFPRQTEAREFVFLDTLYHGEREELLSRVHRLTSPDEFLVIVISKSGATIETLANAKLLLAELENKFKHIEDRMIVITTETSPLSVWARSHSITTIFTPNTLSDRFSVFSPMGMVPLLFGGFFLKEIREGAKSALADALQNKTVFRASWGLSQIIPPSRHSLLDLFFFSPRLETLGKWHRQLMAESLGKSKTLSGEPLERSLTPTVSIGTTDLHSMLQLTLAQPSERVTWFVRSTEDAEDRGHLPSSFADIPSIPHDRSPSEIVDAIYQGVLEAYEQQKIPYLQSSLDSISERTLGAYMMEAMLVTLGLAHLWNIDPFDQPFVEGYKEKARDILKG